jgi:hypothetical protein
MMIQIENIMLENFRRTKMVHKSNIQKSLDWTKFSRLFIFLMFILTPFTTTFGQNPIKKEVEVVKPYEPVVSDANKINILPKINDSVMIKPMVQYSIVPTMMNTEYQVSPINAAKMLAMPIPKLYKGYLKLGFGNYTSPLIEAYVNSLRSKKGSASFFFRHRSSAGTVTLDNQTSVNAGYSETSGELSGKKFINAAVLDGSVFLGGNSVFHYGYNPILDTMLQKGDIRQNFTLFKLNTGLHSMHTDSSKLSYHVNLGFNFFRDRTDHEEKNFDINGKFSKRYENK